MTTEHHCSAMFQRAFDGIESRQATPRPLRTLVVDDNPHVRSVLRFGVTRLNGLMTEDGREIAVTVDEASNGAEAVQRICMSSYDLFIIDFYMPIMDGGVLIDRLRQTPESVHTPIIVASASPEEIAEVTTRYNNVSVMAKPLLARDLCRLIVDQCELGPLRSLSPLVSLHGSKDQSGLLG